MPAGVMLTFFVVLLLLVVVDKILLYPHFFLKLNSVTFSMQIKDNLITHTHIYFKSKKLISDTSCMYCS